MEFNHQEIESKWKSRWDAWDIYRVTHKSEAPKYYVLDMFPYPSGSGLHVGHPLGYIASDIMSRYKRMSGYNVLHPMGYDAFGLPAEQYAIQTGIHPAKATGQNVKRYRSQLNNLGFSYDWNREVKTSDPEFYQWTQWIFIQLYHHYYDQTADQAMPIAHLVRIFEKEGNSNIKTANSQDFTFSPDEWHAFSPKEQDDILMNYRLAYRKVGYVNWCAELGTVLANDEVKDGLSERGGYPVERKAMLQWSLRITAYAERLLNSLDDLDWSDSMKLMQSNWIGRSVGAEMFFKVQDSEARIDIFTTRPDTIFGATFMVLAPEHPLLEQLVTPAQKDTIAAYQKYVRTRSERDRLAVAKEVSGAFTGAYAINPFTEQPIPIWIAEYVLMEYGTGAIMAVPSDDQRDFAFAQKFDLPVIEIIDRSEYPDASMEDKVGKMINSGFLTGMEVSEAIPAIIREMEARGVGFEQINYRMRDAIFSRQRYWGEPIPIYYDDEGVSHALDTEELPLILPELDDFKPSGVASPLSRLKSWVNLPGVGERETDTMPGYAGSSWYFLRYMDPHNKKAFASQEALGYWRDVDLYIGGTEHAVGHLMYSRFWHKFLYDKGWVPTKEPFRKLVNQGMIQGVIEYIYLLREKDGGYHKFLCARLAAQRPDTAYIRIPVLIAYVTDYGSQDSFLNTDGIRDFIQWRPEYKEAIFECANGIFHKGRFTPNEDATSNQLYTESEIGKMSKRYYNVVNPDDVVAEYGADCFRMFEMFLGPVEQSKPWDTRSIDGVSKFLRKFWNLFFSRDGKFFVSEDTAIPEARKIVHQTIKKVRADIERLSFNTCVSHFMICTNTLRELNSNHREVLEPLVALLAPFAPFISEELWSLLGHSSSVHLAEYPTFNPEYIREDAVEYPVCVNGKKRTSATIPVDASKSEIESLVLDLEVVRKWINGKDVKRIIVVPGRMINIVV